MILTGIDIIIEINVSFFIYTKTILLKQEEIFSEKQQTIYLFS